MKKIYMLFLVLTLAFALCACSKDEPAKNTDNKTTDTPSTTNTNITVAPTEEVTPEPTSDPSKADITSPVVTDMPIITEEITPEPTEEVTPEPTEEITPEPTEKPAQGINPVLLTEDDWNNEQIFAAKIDYTALEASLREFCETRYNDPEKEYTPMACLGEEYGLSSGRTLQDEWNDYGFDSPFIFLDLFQKKTIDYEKFNQIDFESHPKTMYNARRFYGNEFRDCIIDYDDAITNKNLITSIGLYYTTKIDFTPLIEYLYLTNSFDTINELFDENNHVKNLYAYTSIQGYITVFRSNVYANVINGFDYQNLYTDDYTNIDLNNIFMDYFMNYMSLNPNTAYGIDEECFHYKESRMFDCVFGPYYNEIYQNFKSTLSRK